MGEELLISVQKYTKVVRGQDRVEIKSMIYLLLDYGMSPFRSSYCVKFGWWGHELKGEKSELARQIRSEKLREHHYREGYAKYLESDRV